MKKLIYFVFAICVFIISSCGNSNNNTSEKEIKDEVKEAAETTKDRLKVEKEELIKMYNAKKDGVKAEIIELKNNIASADNDVKESLKSKLEDLELRQTKIEKKINKIKDSSEEAYQELKKNIEMEWNDFENAIKEIKEELG